MEGGRLRADVRPKLTQFWRIHRIEIETQLSRICVPLYDYQCKKCGHRFEKIQKFSDPEIKKCPECGGEVERLLSAPAVQFKGSGWYVTDYAKKSSGASSSGSSDKPAAKSDSSESTAKKTENKPGTSETK
jgi:putative FmdB family regulatory protein